MAFPPSTPLPLPLTLRPQTVREALLLSLWLTDPAAEWRQWDAPYLLPAPDAYTAGGPADYTHADHTHHERLIFVGEQAVGLVTRTPEAPSSGGWWELGILIYDPQHWGGGFGTRALRDWTALTFQETGAHVLTLSTWSGNARMIRAAAKVGYRECARVREARLWQGVRFDSVRLDLLRREWEESLKSGGGEQA